MKTLICEESLAFGLAASGWCRDKILQYDARSIFIPAGNTPIALYKTWQSERPSYLNGISLVQIDEVLTGPKRGVFKEFFKEHLPDFQKQISFIENGNEKADLALLGLGLNGHVAFHEPGLHPTFYSGCVSLSDVTVGYLGLERGTWGLSYGTGAFIECRALLFMVSGAGKCEILKRLLSGDTRLPASALLHHPDISVLADGEALPKRGQSSGSRIGNGEPKENEIS